MKRITSILIALLIGISNIDAQSIADNEYKLRNYFWFGTDNASSLSQTPIDIMGNLSLIYNYENGGLHLQQNPQSLNNASLQTSGIGKVGGWTLWGDFSFTNKFEKGTRYNTINYEIEEDMPYFVADTFASGWNKQAYIMSMKIASPIVWDRVSFGLRVDYDTKVGAKQKDPRCETYKRNFALFPSATISLGAHTLGLYAEYESEFERTEPDLENYRKTQKVYISNGLGEGLVAKVGDNDGIKTFLFNGLTFGGGLQYGYKGTSAEIFSELCFEHFSKTSTQNPKLPKPMGQIARNRISADIKGAFGSKRNHLAKLGAIINITRGNEYILKLNKTEYEQNWDIIAINPMSNFTRMNIHAGYDYQQTRSGRFDWAVGVDADFSSRDYSYISPADYFGANNILCTAHGDKQFTSGAHSFLLGLEGGYNLSLGAQYTYTGSEKTLPLQQLYHEDAAILASDYYNAGVRLVYGYKARAISYNIDLGAKYLRSTTLPLDRIVATVTASLTF